MWGQSGSINVEGTPAVALWAVPGITDSPPELLRTNSLETNLSEHGVFPHADVGWP